MARDARGGQEACGYLCRLPADQNVHSQKGRYVATLPVRTSIPERNWEQISIECLSQLPVTGRGNNAIIAFVDRMSKMIRNAPTKTKVTAPGFAKLLVSNVVKHHGLPKALCHTEMRDSRVTFGKP